MAGSRKFPAPDFLERQRLDIAGVSIFFAKNSLQIPADSLQIRCKSAVLACAADPDEERNGSAVYSQSFHR
jgi:hypothetical protein